MVFFVNNFMIVDVEVVGSYYCGCVAECNNNNKKVKVETLMPF